MSASSASRPQTRGPDISGSLYPIDVHGNTERTTNRVTAAKNVILRVVQQVRTRTAAWELIEMARVKGVGHIPDILHDLRKDVGERRNLHEIFSVLDQGPDYEDRVVRAIVSTKYMTLEARLAEFPEDVMIVAEQMVNCLHDLRYKAFILHCDVSSANIMCEISEGKPRFILNDSDLVCHLDDEGEPEGASPSIYRTGTLPFVAVDLLYDFDTLSPKEALRNATPKPHRLRHDLESLFWTVLAGILLSQKEKASKDQWDAVVAQLRKWEKDDLFTIAGHKIAIIESDTNYLGLPLPPLFVTGAPGRWLEAFRDVFAARVSKRKEKQALQGTTLRTTRLTEAELDSIINKETILQAFGTAHV